MFKITPVNTIDLYEIYFESFKQSFENKKYLTYIEDIKEYHKTDLTSLKSVNTFDSIYFFSSQSNPIYSSDWYYKDIDDCLKKFMSNYNSKFVDLEFYKVFYNINYKKLQKYYLHSDKFPVEVLRDYDRLVKYRKLIIIELLRVLELKTDFTYLSYKLINDLISNLKYPPNLVEYKSMLNLRKKIWKVIQFDSTNVEVYQELIKSNYIDLINYVDYTETPISANMSILKNISEDYADKLNSDLKLLHKITLIMKVFRKDFDLHSVFKYCESSLGITQKKFDEMCYNYLIVFAIIVELINVNLNSIGNLDD